MSVLAMGVDRVRTVRWSLRAKFALAIVVLVAVVLGANAALFQLFNQRRLRQESERDARAYALLAAAPIVKAYDTYYTSGYGKFRQIVERLQSLNPDVTRIEIFATDGRRVFSTTEFKERGFDPMTHATPVTKDTAMLAAIRSLELAAFRRPDDSGAERVIVAPDVEEWGGHRYSVVYSFSARSEQLAERTALIEVAGLTALSLGVGILIALLLAQQSLRPLEKLTGMARSLSEGKLDRRIQLPTGDEFEVLADAFNDSAQRLATTINHLEEANRTLTEANRELRTVDRVKSDLLANVSHELRTPLTAIRGYTEAMQDGFLGDIDPDQQEALVAIRRNVERLMGMIDQLLDFSRAEAGVAALELAAFDMRALAQQVVETSSIADRRTHRIVLEAPEHVALVYGDADKLRQVLENLIGNAIKFTPSSGSITVRLANREREVVVSVSDTGIGIAEQERERIFDRFYQVDATSTRRYGGMGLGLSLVREIVTAHHSHIEVESAPGKGTTFRFTLPVAVQTMEFATPTLGTRVLLVDDDPVLTQQLTSYLTNRGFAVRVAHTAADAKRLIEEMKPDVIVLDRLLPDADGFDLLDGIRKSPRTAELPVIVISVRPEREIGLRRGASGYLVKPVEPRALRELIAELLARHPIRAGAGTPATSSTPLSAPPARGVPA